MTKRAKVKPVTAWGGWMVFTGSEPDAFESCDEHSGPNEYHLESTVFWSEDDARKRGQDVRYVEIKVLKP
jgi:hypothetical protein